MIKEVITDSRVYVGNDHTTFINLSLPTKIELTEILDFGKKIRNRDKRVTIKGSYTKVIKELVESYNRYEDEYLLIENVFKTIKEMVLIGGVNEEVIKLTHKYEKLFYRSTFYSEYYSKIERLRCITSEYIAEDIVNVCYYL